MTELIQSVSLAGFEYKVRPCAPASGGSSPHPRIMRYFTKNGVSVAIGIPIEDDWRPLLPNVRFSLEERLGLSAGSTRIRT